MKGSSGRQVTFVPGTSISHINGPFIRTLRSDTSHSKGTRFLLVLPLYFPIFKFRVSFKLKTSDFRVRLHYFSLALFSLVHLLQLINTFCYCFESLRRFFSFPIFSLKNKYSMFVNIVQLSKVPKQSRK